MPNIHPKTPAQANYRILNLIEQMVAVAPKGTALGLCDLISALFSGYFIESGGAVMPAVEAFLRQGIEDELAVFDAGFKLVEATQTGIERCLIRLAKNCTFGKTAGRIPERTSAKGPNPTQYQAEIVRELIVHIWHKLYFLERHLSDINDGRKKHELRHMPLKVMAIYDPDFDDPLGFPFQKRPLKSWYRSATIRHEWQNWLHMRNAYAPHRSHPTGDGRHTNEKLCLPMVLGHLQ
jgi:hypothetical protein